MFGEVTKISRRSDGALAGAAGDATYNSAFLMWFLSFQLNDAPKAEESDNTIDRGVIFYPDGRIDVYEPRGRFAVKAPYYAFGSGKAEALGALFAGADAETAVRAAIAIDPHSGGNVTVLSHGR